MRVSYLGKLIFLSTSLWLVVTAQALIADDADASALNERFKEVVAPIISRNCLTCHVSTHKEAELSLESYRELSDVAGAHGVWEIVLERVEAGEMPPEDAKSQIADSERQTMIDWIHAARRFEALRTAGDPGPVLARRLSNAEYDNSIRDLTGFDLRPTQTFPVDPANTAGFDNSGESLNMSPALLNKYLAAARSVAEHLVFTPSGLAFAPHPVVTDTDRDKYCVKRIVEFYERQPTDLASYFFAACEFRRRLQAETTLEEIAKLNRISPKYLKTIWELLEDERDTLGPLAKLKQMWKTLPDDTETMQACAAMRDYVLETRKQFESHFDNLDIDGVHDGSQSFVLWKNKQYARHRRTANFEPPSTNSKKQKTKDKPVEVSASEPLFELPSDDQLAQFQSDCQQFCAVFPDSFYVSERGRDYLDKPRDEQEKGRLLSAGFHSMMGYFRDDQPLMELILDESEQQELDGLWEELDFFAAAPQRQYQGFLWFERTDSRFMREAEFDFSRPEDKAALTSPYIQQLSEVYLAKATRSGGEGEALQAIRDFFLDIDSQIRWVEQTRIAAEPRHVDAIVDLASRANRRPLSSDQEISLRKFYQQLREQQGLSHEEAIQDALVSMLLEPEFLYRVDLLSDSEPPRALDDYELASRLSYFLWSSSPDAELLACAERGQLRDRQVLLLQARRMLGDWKVRGLATEFAGNLLDFRRFEEHNAVDRVRFASFDSSLRSAMFEEPIRFFIDLVQSDRSITDLLVSERTFVNAVLAKHYGMHDLELDEDRWQEVDSASKYDRGGLLPMAVFLTKNAPGLRTSPVKRGYWVVRRLLGERIPPPPPNVPDLPDDEAQLGELSLRETLAKHRQHASCAGCHDRIDSIGLVFENYGPIGELRELDLGGRAIDTHAEFPDGSTGAGLADLKSYLMAQRQQDFTGNFHSKLLTFALGRTLQLSDQMVLEEMAKDGAANENRFWPLIETIVTSPQFLNKRGRGDLAVEPFREGATHE